MNEHHADRFPIVAVAENGLEMGRWLATLACVREKEKESARTINVIKNISPSAGERTNERTNERRCGVLCRICEHFLLRIAV